MNTPDSGQTFQYWQLAIGNWHCCGFPLIHDVLLFIIPPMMTDVEDIFTSDAADFLFIWNILDCYESECRCMVNYISSLVLCRNIYSVVIHSLFSHSTTWVGLPKFKHISSASIHTRLAVCVVRRFQGPPTCVAFHHRSHGCGVCKWTKSMRFFSGSGRATEHASLYP